MEGVGIVLFRGADQGVFQIGNETVVALEQGEIDLDALPDAGIEKPLGDAVAIGGIGSPPCAPPKASALCSGTRSP